MRALALDGKIPSIKEPVEDPNAHQRAAMKDLAQWLQQVHIMSAQKAAEALKKSTVEHQEQILEDIASYGTIQSHDWEMSGIVSGFKRS